MAATESVSSHQDQLESKLPPQQEQRSLPLGKRCFTQMLLGDTDGLDMYNDDEGGRDEDPDAGASMSQLLDEDDCEEEFTQVMEMDDTEPELEELVDSGDSDQDREAEELVDVEYLDEDEETGVDCDGEVDRKDEDELDPLALVEEDAQGQLPYEQFERLEYEALAARKRRDRLLASKSAETSTPHKGKYQDLFGASVDEIWESAGFGAKRRRRGSKKRGRKKLPAGGVRVTPEVSKKLGDANLLYATGKFDEAIKLLAEVVKLAPYVPDAYHTYGLVYEAVGNRKKALGFYMLAAVLTPKDSALWKRLASWSMEQGNIGQVIWCLSKAIRADPDDDDAKWDRATLYIELQDFKKAADCFEQILASRPTDMEACKMVAKMQQKVGNVERAIQVLETLLEEHPAEADLTAVNLLAELQMQTGAFAKAVLQIDRARLIYCPEHGLPVDLAVKAGICHAYSGNLTEAELYFEDLWQEKVEKCADLILEVGDAYLALEEHERAIKYFELLNGVVGYDNATVWLKIAECHVALQSFETAIPVYHQVVKQVPQHVEARLALVNFLINNKRQEEAVALLVPPAADSQDTSESFGDEQPWWKEAKIKLKLANIFYSQEKYPEYVDTLLPLIRETLCLEALNQKERQAKCRKGLHKSVLAARVKFVDDQQHEEVFQGFAKPIISRTDLAKASRAKKKLAKLAAQKEEKRVAALAAGLEWASDEDSDETPPELDLKTPPLPNLLKDDDNYYMLMQFLQTCKTLATTQRYFEALDVIHNVLAVGHNVAKERRDELRCLGAQIAYKTRDPKHGYECVRYMVQQKPYSNDMWSCYYQVISRATLNRTEGRVPKHNKFMLQMRVKYPDCVPAMMLCGHQFSMISQPQGALREYLQAYKFQPENTFVCLCIGVAFVNLSLGFRLSNRNQTLLQGFTFLYQYQRLSKYSQESYYNLARAFHHVGFTHLAVLYYEKVLSRFERDRPIVTVTNHGDEFEMETRNPPIDPSKRHVGHCDLRREAAHNLHLIYKKSGAVDLARQVLKDHGSF